MTRLNLPPDIAKQKIMEAQQQNQVYSMAFQIYVQCVHQEFTPSLFGELAKHSINAAKIFIQTVQEDAKHAKNSP